ncbi:hypothetical protein [Nostoc sp. UHCC 0251]|uniref:hypothetical protein n=1 Tax=Nostoc sp. UHCC 0251 TaxID=3110240 RepID=UPI002B20F87E|nr:hypothetical protein [Nostoc sp. UHCC 0251]MEA5625840.1 hypothetical protein [Nostoc sp. UHCC 0251]
MVRISSWGGFTSDILNSYNAIIEYFIVTPVRQLAHQLIFRNIYPNGDRTLKRDRIAIADSV